MTQAFNQGQFVGTTNVWDVAELEDVNVNSEEFKELLVRLYQNLNLISVTLNDKDSGLYDPNTQFPTGQSFFSNPTLNSSSAQTPTRRQVLRTVVTFGTLPNATITPLTSSQPHGISVTPNTSFVKIYGVANDPTDKSYIPLPYASAVSTNIIELDVDATNVTITVNGNMSAYTNNYVVLEYLIN